MRIAHLLVAIAIVLGSVLAGALAPAADLQLDGKWMITEVKGLGDNSGSMEAAPGAMTVEIHGASMVMTMVFDPSKPPEKTTSTIAVTAKAADQLTMTTTSPDGVETCVVTRDASGKGLIFTAKDSITTLVPWDAAAVAKEDAAQAEKAKPAAPIADHPLSGKFGGAEWTALVCQRSDFQFKDDVVRCEISAVKPPEHGPSPASIIISMPKKAGAYPLGPMMNATFFTPPGKNKTAMHGELVIYKIDGTKVDFGLSARADADNEINGRMSVDLGPAPKP
jgi:hypothetical protein